MKKEIKNKLAEFIKKEEDLVVAIHADPNNQTLINELMNLREEKKNWLCEIGGIKDGMKPEDAERLSKLISDAESEMSRAAAIGADSIEFINRAAQKIRQPIPNYEATIDDNGQMLALAEDSAKAKVRKVDNFNKKMNRRNFLNVVICRFKRQKSMESSEEQQGPSQR